MKPFLSLLVLCSLLVVASSCPQNETLLLLCRCTTSFNGIILDCSNQNAGVVLQVLKENQVQLGLVQELSLQNSSLVSVGPHMFKGLYIKKLDLGHNRISSVHQHGFEGLDTIIQSISLIHNQLEEIPAEGISGLAALLKLDLSNNTIGSLEHTQSFKNVPKLFDLNLANNKICKIQKTVFDAVKHSIQTLNLGHNCLTKAPASAIRGFKQLLALHLHNNFIAQLDPLEFMNLPLLNLINLAGNRISRIHRQAFLNVPNLRMIYMSDNNVTELQAHMFRHFETLEMLDLTRNKIERVPSLAFANMPRLSQLYLGENSISVIEKDAFANSSIVILLLPTNRLVEITGDMFNGMNYLQQFNLKNNSIASIAQNSFYQMPSLVMIDLSHNQLTALYPATFLTQLNMFLVELSHNQLVTTPYNAFNKRVMTVILQENPLVCRERVHMLQQGVGVYVPGTPDLVCGGVATQQPTNTGNSNYPQQAVNLNTNSISPSFIQEGVVPPPIARNTTTIINPQVTLRPDYFTRPIIRPVNTQQSTIGATHGIPSTIPGLIQPPPAIQSRVPSVQTNRPQPLVPLVRQPLVPLVETAPPQTPTVGFTIPTQSNPIDILTSSTAAFAPETLPYVPETIWTTTAPATAQQTPGPNERYRPRTIRPLPIPFLTRNPLGGAFAITTPSTTTPFPTLPAGIITASTAGSLPRWTPPKTVATEAPWTPPVVPTRNPLQPWQEVYNGRQGNFFPPGPPQQPQQPQQHRPQPPPQQPVGPERPQQPQRPQPQPNAPELPPQIDAVERPTRPIVPNYPTPRPRTTIPPLVKTVAPKKPDVFGAPDAAVAGPFDENGGEGGAVAGSATTTIAVCLTVVVVVMVAVFITLCVVRHRSNSKRNSSSHSTESRTSAYVAQQAARVNYAASNYGNYASLARLNPTGRPMTGGGSVRGNPHTWIYAPGSSTLEEAS